MSPLFKSNKHSLCFQRNMFDTTRSNLICSNLIEAAHPGSALLCAASLFFVGTFGGSSGDGRTRTYVRRGKLFKCFHAPIDLFFTCAHVMLLLVRLLPGVMAYQTYISQSLRKRLFSLKQEKRKMESTFLTTHFYMKFCIHIITYTVHCK